MFSLSPGLANCSAVAGRHHRLYQGPRPSLWRKHSMSLDTVAVCSSPRANDWLSSFKIKHIFQIHCTLVVLILSFIMPRKLGFTTTAACYAQQKLQRRHYMFSPCPSVVRLSVLMSVSCQRRPCERHDSSKAARCHCRRIHSCGNMGKSISCKNKIVCRAGKSITDAAAGNCMTARGLYLSCWPLYCQTGPSRCKPRT